MGGFAFLLLHMALGLEGPEGPDHVDAVGSVHFGRQKTEPVCCQPEGLSCW